MMIQIVASNFMVILLLLTIVNNRCSNRKSVSPDETSSIFWNSVNDFVYQLQNIDLVAIGNTKFDLVIIDYLSHCFYKIFNLLKNCLYCLNTI